jgi:SpoVK/Ycf46/Vps4 family AAA+-type ATPase
VQVEITLPDESGRQRIVGIHSKRLRERDCLEPGAAAAISSGALAEATAGFSGADLAGLLRSATSFALERYIESTLLQGYAPGATGVAIAKRQAQRAAASSAAGKRRGVLEVSLEDLLRALREVHPTGSAASRAEMRRAGGRRNAGAWAAGALRAWRREARLRALVNKAMRA